MLSHTEIYVESTGAGIKQVEILTDIDSDSEGDHAGEDFEMDENLQSCELENRDFDNVEGVE
jgi:hypothetical protein